MQLVKGALVNAIRLKDEATLASGEKMIQEVSLRIVVYWKVESDRRWKVSGNDGNEAVAAMIVGKLPVHHLLDEVLGAADAGADSVEGEAGLVGDVLVGEVVEQAQFGYPAVAVGEGGDGADEEVVGLVVNHVFLGGTFCFVAICDWFVGFGQFDGGEVVAAADVVNRGVAGNGEYPAPEQVLRVECTDVLVGFPEAFLADVLGIGGVGADGLDVEAQLAGVAGGQG